MRVASVLYPNGTVLTNTYDSRGNRVSSTLGDYTEQFAYDQNNNVISQKEGGDLVMTWGYNGLDRPTNVTYLTGTQSYDFGSSYYKGGEFQSATVTDPVSGLLKNETVNLIDAFGRPLSVTQHGTTFSPRSHLHARGPFQHRYRAAADDGDRQLEQRRHPDRDVNPAG